MESVRFFLGREHGPGLLSSDSYYTEALTAASSSGHLTMLRYLYELKAHDHIASGPTRSPRESADIKLPVQNRYQPFVEHLILIGASTSGNIETVEYAVGIGADVNAEDRHGRTALRVAAFNGFFDIVKYLVEMGAGWGPSGCHGNKIAALGENILLLMNIGGLDALYTLFFFRKLSFKKLEVWQTCCIPVYIGWMAVIIFVFPLIFQFV